MVGHVEAHFYHVVVAFENSTNTSLIRQNSDKIKLIKKEGTDAKTEKVNMLAIKPQQSTL